MSSLSYWQKAWESKADEPDFAASGRSSGDAGQLFALLADAFRALRPGPSDTLIDLGCGVGLLSWHIAPYVQRVIGIDFASRLLLRARKRVPGGEFLAADILGLPFADRSLSLILASSVLQYLDSDEAVGNALKEMRRVAAPGARVFVSGNPDKRKKQEYIAGIDHLDLPQEKKDLIRERNEKAFWICPDTLGNLAKDVGWKVEVRSISPVVWQSHYMFDLFLEPR